MRVEALDHLVLTVADVAATVRFYEDVLGMQPVRFDTADGPSRWALMFGVQKINLHQAGAEFAPMPTVPRWAQPICVSSVIRRCLHGCNGLKSTTSKSLKALLSAQARKPNCYRFMSVIPMAI